MLQATDESARQRALDTYRVLDSLPEAAYDDIVRLASMLCDAPIALHARPGTSGLASCVEHVFLRADEALSREKDALAQARERRRAAR